MASEAMVTRQRLAAGVMRCAAIAAHWPSHRVVWLRLQQFFFRHSLLSFLFFTTIEQMQHQVSLFKLYRTDVLTIDGVPRTRAIPRELPPD
jgi:hypothetical protein